MGLRRWVARRDPWVAVARKTARDLARAYVFWRSTTQQAPNRVFFERFIEKMHAQDPYTPEQLAELKRVLDETEIPAEIITHIVSTGPMVRHVSSVLTDNFGLGATLTQEIAAAVSDELNKIGLIRPVEGDET